MVRIYHNPRCKHSRAGLTYLQNKVEKFEVINYIKEPLTKDKLSRLVAKTGQKPIDLVRKQEDYYKKKMKGKELSEQEIIVHMAENPRVIARPIVETEQKAVLANPPELIDDLLQ